MGLTEQEATLQGIPHEVLHIPASSSDRIQLEEEFGWLKVILAKGSSGSSNGTQQQGVGLGGGGNGVSRPPAVTNPAAIAVMAGGSSVPTPHPPIVEISGQVLKFCQNLLGIEKQSLVKEKADNRHNSSSNCPFCYCYDAS